MLNAERIIDKKMAKKGKLPAFVTRVIYVMGK